MDELMSIGDFAGLSGLSPKRLRSYAANGLLTPAAVHPDTAYRYYSAAQLALARGGRDNVSVVVAQVCG